MNFDKPILEDIVKNSNSFRDVLTKINKPYNGRHTKWMKSVLECYNINYKHFSLGQKIKYLDVEKICPSCGQKFLAKSGHPKEKKVCSVSCSNSFFIRKKSEDELKSYRVVCFRYHKKECVVCGEKNIVTVHHFDECKENNSPENLIPMCPTHHQYWHSKYKMLVYDKVLKYRIEFMKQHDNIHPSFA